MSTLKPSRNASKCAWVTPEKRHQTDRLFHGSFAEAPRLSARRDGSFERTPGLLWFPAPCCLWIPWLDVASLPLWDRLRQKVSLTRRYLCSPDKGEFTRHYLIKGYPMWLLSDKGKGMRSTRMNRNKSHQPTCLFVFLLYLNLLFLSYFGFAGAKKKKKI